MSNGCASRCTGETAVGDQGNTGTKSHTHDRGSRVQHFSHTRAAFWAFVTDDDHITRIDLLVVDRCDSVFLRIKDSCRSFMHHHLSCYCRLLDNAAVRSKIALQDRNTAALRERIVDRTDNFRIEVLNTGQILAHGLACSCDHVQI